jgi:hypothetical protein
MEAILLKQKTADLLAKAVTDVLEEMGISTTEVLEATLRMSIPPEMKEVARQAPIVGLAQALRQKPEPTKEELKEVLSRLTAFKTMPQHLRAIYKEAKKGLPRARSGPHKKLGPERKATACGKVTSLLGQYSSREAIKIVARENKISERTMYRIWREHWQAQKTTSSRQKRGDSK